MLMNRRKFVVSCALALQDFNLQALSRREGLQSFVLSQIVNAGAVEVNKPVNIARYGELRSWENPDVEIVRDQLWGKASTGFRVREAYWKDNQFDLGVEWPEYRPINKIVLHFGSGEAPSPEKCFLERWEGLSPLQGSWKPAEVVEPYERGGNIFEGTSWTLSIPTVRTCKVRLRLLEQRELSIGAFEVYGPSIWKNGKLRIEWGHLETERTYNGHLEIYNGEILGIQPLENTRLTSPLGWASTAGKGKIAGLLVDVMYTSGANADRTILTLRNSAGDLSFLPRECVETLPIDVPDFGIYICNAAAPVDRSTFRQNNSNKYRIMDAVAKHPEQTLENAYEHIATDREVAFIGVDSNSQKFGIAPAGHVTVGYDDPSFGRGIMEKFAVNFDTASESTFAQEPLDVEKNIFKDSKDKQQELFEGWLPEIGRAHV